ncbi:hypothetical protein F511_30914 [Dorcoceras hygrometricum]|uniref:Uncharacterized protein n=1 Tax=Dorcoceras hygrometricum TaxID=472368 RepID=A0A2Z7CFN9_9LAMI|nr:hypothetical protein F511_30914 [Dorcoceras hygrometricum]
MRIRPPELKTSICDAKYHVSLPPPPSASTPPPPLIDRTCSDQSFEENPSALISSGLLVQADDGVSLPIVDLIDESTAAYREEPFVEILIVLNVSRPNFILPLPRRETGSGSAKVPQQWYQSVRLGSIDTITAILYLIFNFSDRKTKFGKQAAGRRHVRRRPPRRARAVARSTPSRASCGALDTIAHWPRNGHLHVAQWASSRRALAARLEQGGRPLGSAGRATSTYWPAAPCSSRCTLVGAVRHARRTMAHGSAALVAAARDLLAAAAVRGCSGDVVTAGLFSRV